MGTTAENFMLEYAIVPESIKYMLHENGRSAIHFTDREPLVTSVPTRELAALMPEGLFVSPRHGTWLAVEQIAEISKQGVYTMADGRTFQGRKRYLSEHAQLRKSLEQAAPSPAPQPELHHSAGSDIIYKCSLLDEMPIPFCLIELVFDEHGHGMDFLFRYCNGEMLVVEGLEAGDVIDHSFFEVFPYMDKKWMASYVDVALNGGRRMIHAYTPDDGRLLTVHVYQPQERFCACILQH